MTRVTACERCFSSVCNIFLVNDCRLKRDLVYLCIRSILRLVWLSVHFNLWVCLSVDENGVGQCLLVNRSSRQLEKLQLHFLRFCLYFMTNDLFVCLLGTIVDLSFSLSKLSCQSHIFWWQSGNFSFSDGCVVFQLLELIYNRTFLPDEVIVLFIQVT